MAEAVAVCRLCSDTGLVDRGIDEDVCPECGIDLAHMRELIAVFSRCAGPISEDEKDLIARFEALMRHWERLVAALNPQPWQTPLSRARELNDNAVLVNQIRVIVKQ